MNKLTIIFVFFLTGITHLSFASDTLGFRPKHMIDIGIVGRYYFGYKGFRYENFDDGLIQRLGSKRGGPPFPFLPYFSFFYHYTHQRNTISLGWQHFKEIFDSRVSIRSYGYQIGYSYSIMDYHRWLKLAPKVVIPVSYGSSQKQFGDISIDLGLGMDVLIFHKSGITLRNELTIQNNFVKKLPFFQHQLCIGYKF